MFHKYYHTVLYRGFVEFWKRTQSTKAMMWGVTGYESLEQDRPQFEGENIHSPITNKPYKYFSRAEKDFRVRVANVSYKFYDIDYS